MVNSLVRLTVDGKRDFECNSEIKTKLKILGLVHVCITPSSFKLSVVSFAFTRCLKSQGSRPKAKAEGPKAQGARPKAGSMAGPHGAPETSSNNNNNSNTLTDMGGVWFVSMGGEELSQVLAKIPDDLFCFFMISSGSCDQFPFQNQ